MLHHRPLVAVFILLAATSALAQESEQMRKSMMFLESVAMPKKAKVCDARIQGYGATFDPAFDAWLKANQKELSEGENLLRADAELHHTSFEQMVESVTSLPAHLLGQSSNAVLQKNCAGMLRKLGVAPAAAAASGAASGAAWGAASRGASAPE